MMMVLVGLLLLPVLGVLTFLLGVPSAFALTVVRSRGAFMGLGLWVLGVRWGFVPEYGGWLGLPWLVVAGFATVFGFMFARVFVVLTWIAWKRALNVWRLLRAGVHPSEIV
jgi:hypothetical protein